MNSQTVARRQQLEDALKRYVGILKQANPEKIIGFGPLATGEIHEWSDNEFAQLCRDRLFFSRGSAGQRPSDF